MSLIGSVIVLAVMYALFVRPFIDMYQEKQAKSGPSAKDLRIGEMRDRAVDAPCRCGCEEQDQALFG